MNKVILMERLTRDLEIRNSNEIALARYTLAVDRRFGKRDGEQTTDYIPCVAFGKIGGVRGEVSSSGNKNRGVWQDPDRKLYKPRWG